MNEIHGKSMLLRVGARFQLARVRVIGSRLYFKDILSDFISAYRKNYSCESALLRLTEDWRAGLDNKELVGVISLDLSKAFDCVSHELLLARLKAYGVAEHGIALKLLKLLVWKSWLPILMITNPDKYQPYQAMIFGNTNYTFNFKVSDINIPVKDDIDLLGVNIDKNPQFNSHVKNICTKVNNFPLSKNGTHRCEV